MKTIYRNIQPYTTKDGSLIRELMHPSHGGSLRQSVAEATVQPGSETLLHTHGISEEIYHVIEGSGIMKRGTEFFAVEAGDTVLITPGTPHSIKNSGGVPLRIFCICSPPYSHDDTELL